MKKMMKVFAVMLAICVLFTALPLTAHAERTIYYDLWVGHTQVNSVNCDDIPSVTKGQASFDPATNTLSLKNATITGHYNNSGIYSRNSLNIVFEGNNKHARR